MRFLCSLRIAIPCVRRNSSWDRTFEFVPSTKIYLMKILRGERGKITLSEYLKGGQNVSAIELWWPHRHSSRGLWHEPRQSSQSQRSAELHSVSPGLCQKSDGNCEGTCPCHSTRSCPPGLAPRSCVLCQRATTPQGEALHE